MQNLSANNLFQLAEQWVNETNTNIFLTGRAGTGKTTFLKHIVATSAKSLMVLAPTGVAALNAGGSTIHSFFKIPFALFLPSDAAQQENVFTPKTLLQHLRYSKQQIQILRSLELLIIDEVSMVRVDLIDMIDLILRRYRNNYEEPFGGVQLLFIGDMYQLPPVVKDYEAQLLAQYYDSQYFFDSKILKEHPPVQIQLQEVFRQTDSFFLNILNDLRVNEVSQETYSALLSKVSKDRPRDERYITLTSHVAKADAINRQGLNDLFTPAKLFHATIDGDFPEFLYPAALELELKEGARVMFIKNDPEKKFYNGKMGTVTRIQGDDLWVQCDEDAHEMQVYPLSWQNTKYSVNGESGELQSDVLGEFRQIPLRTAWAVTIHKSQGLTFDYVVIDAGQAFAAGQVYVALSRCRTWEGVVLLSAIQPKALFTDLHIVRFGSQVWKEQQLQDALPGYRRVFLQDLYNSWFQWTHAKTWIRQMQDALQQHYSSFSKETLDYLIALSQHIHDLKTVSEKFSVQLAQLQSPQLMPDENPALQVRMREAAQYFLQQSSEKITEPLKQLPAAPDSVVLGTQLLNTLTQIKTQLAEQQAIWQAIIDDLPLKQITAAKRRAQINAARLGVMKWAKAGAKPAAAFKGSAMRQLDNDLRAWRSSVAESEDVPLYRIISNQVIDSICEKLPNSKTELLKISGLGKKKVGAYGDVLLQILSAYTEVNYESEALFAPEVKKKAAQAGDSLAHTLQLIELGKSLDTIAIERKLARSTIEGHVALLIEQGKADAKDFISADKIELIRNAFKQLPPEEQTGLTALRKNLYEAYSFSELKMALAGYKDWQANA